MKLWLKDSLPFVSVTVGYGGVSVLIDVSSQYPVVKARPDLTGALRDFFAWQTSPRVHLSGLAPWRLRRYPLRTGDSLSIRRSQTEERTLARVAA